MAVPALVELIAAQRVKTATFDFYSSLVLARSEAIKRAAVVDVIPRSGDFANGWDVRVGGAVLRTRTNLPQLAVTAPADVALAYDNNGRLTAPGRYTLTLAAPGFPNIPMRCVVIDPSGRASVRLDQNRDGNCFNG
jgi:type IV fimbrial biogenesis protein FimT